VLLHKATSAATRELGFTVLERVGDIVDADRSLEPTRPVVPAKAGTHFDFRANARWIPAFAGMTGLRLCRNDARAPFVGISDGRFRAARRPL